MDVMGRGCAAGVKLAAGSGRSPRELEHACQMGDEFRP